MHGCCPRTAHVRPQDNSEVNKQNKSFNTSLPNIVAWHYKENVNFCLTARKAAFPAEYTSLVNKQEFLYSFSKV